MSVHKRAHFHRVNGSRTNIGEHRIFRVNKREGARAPETNESCHSLACIDGCVAVHWKDCRPSEDNSRIRVPRLVDDTAGTQKFLKTL